LLREIRKQSGLTLEELTEKAGIKSSWSFSRIEKGYSHASLDLIYKWGEALDVFGEETPRSKEVKKTYSFDSGEEIKKFREENGWTQKNLAQKLGCSSQSVSAWEMNVTKPRGSAKMLIEYLASRLEYPNQVEEERRVRPKKWTSEMIKEYREKLGWTQNDLAQRVGCKPESVCAWEKGITKPSGTAQRLLGLVFSED